MDKQQFHIRTKINDINAEMCVRVLENYLYGSLLKLLAKPLENHPIVSQMIRLESGRRKLKIVPEIDSLNFFRNMHIYI